MLKETLLFSAAGAAMIGVVVAATELSVVFLRPEITYSEAVEEKTQPYELTVAPKVESSVPVGIGKIYKVPEAVSLSNKDLDCLIRNIYFESAHQDVARLSIAQVTMNRLSAGKWGNSVCSVVFWKRQFSWVNTTDRLVKDPVRWSKASDAAKMYVEGYRVKGLENSMFFHAAYMPVQSWAKKMTIVLEEGGHLFFEEKKLNHESKRAPSFRS